MNAVIIQGRLYNTERDIAKMFFENDKYNFDGCKCWAIENNKQIILNREFFRKFY